MTTVVGASLATTWNEYADPPNAGFLIREDMALRERLTGMKVFANNGPTDGIPVPVYFRLPEDEVRARSFPYVIIDFLAVARDATREHRGVTSMPDGYHPPGVPNGVHIDFPIPVNLSYQVSTFTRNVQQDRQLVGQLITRLPVRFGALEMSAARGAPDDNSMRRLDLTSGPVTRDTKEGGKRIFSKVYSLSIASELIFAEIGLLAEVRQIFLDPPTATGYSGVVEDSTQVAP